MSVIQTEIESLITLENMKNGKFSRNTENADFYDCFEALK